MISLNKYNQKRNFNSTVEPEGAIKKSTTELVFVMQKHAASHLHYDFRLEMDGVLKSWAIPKGPSMNPAEKRLAIMVEDHPYDYKDFEGIIPEGNYGAGTVMIWDNGTYTLADGEEAENVEKKLKSDLAKGHLSFILNGKKLKGEFALVELKTKQDNSWLLIKKNDQYASTEDILEQDRSVISDRTLESLEVAQ
ncbi:MAG TPA: DNA polymerase ligase N-terminal domain-containing protein [Flavobacterium sp.]